MKTKRKRFNTWDAVFHRFLGIAIVLLSVRTILNATSSRPYISPVPSSGSHNRSLLRVLGDRHTKISVFVFRRVPYYGNTFFFFLVALPPGTMNSLIDMYTKWLITLSAVALIVKSGSAKTQQRRELHFYSEFRPKKQNNDGNPIRGWMPVKNESVYFICPHISCEMDFFFFLFDTAHFSISHKFIAFTRQYIRCNYS